MDKSLIISRHTTILFLAIFVVMELPIRLFLQPDPWLLPVDHWYFSQPSRLFIELGLGAVLTVVLFQGNRLLLTIPREHVVLLLISMLVSLLIFGVLEFDQLTASLDAPLLLWLAWLATGFLIGVGQELLYRGLLFTSLNNFLTERISGVATTVIFVFAPLHSVRLWEYFQSGHFSTVVILIGIYIGVGTFFQWLRSHTGSVAIPALVHGVGNAITWVAVFS